VSCSPDELGTVEVLLSVGSLCHCEVAARFPAATPISCW